MSRIVFLQRPERRRHRWRQRQANGLNRHVVVGLAFAILMGCGCGVYETHCTPIRILQFYSQSFAPLNLQVSYMIENNIAIYYNVSALAAFPGKLIFNVFVRRLPRRRGDRAKNVAIYKNLDFCKSIEAVRNLTLDNMYEDATPMQSTFITSCPLTEGFYYITNLTVSDELVPMYVTDGDYWIQFELLQILDEVNRLINIKAKVAYTSPW